MEGGENWETQKSFLTLLALMHLGVRGEKKILKLFFLTEKVRDSFFVDCVGVDLNRNFPVGFGDGGDGYGDDVSDPCSDSYGGAEPFSEAEATALRRGIQFSGRRRRRRVLAHVSVHCCAAAVLSPAGMDPEASAAAAAAARAMTGNATAIRHGSASRVFGRRFGGGVLQWAAGEAEAAFVVEAPGFRGRRSGRSRFDVEGDKEEAEERVEAVLRGLDTIMDEVLRRKLYWTS